jgi:hypothetical protein
MKQAKQRFYDNISEHLDDLKTVNSKIYWKTIHMLLKKAVSVFVLKNICRSLSRLRDSRRKSESNHTLSSLRMVTSLVGMHVFVILANILMISKQ